MGWTLQRLERAVENFSTQLQCAICLCAYDNPVSLPCNHCFCEECIHRALELKDVCPICKTPAKKRRLRYDTMIQELMRATEMLCGPPETGKPAEEGKNKSKSSEKLKIEAQQAKSRALKAVDAAIKRDSIATTAAVAPASTAASTDGSIESGAAETTAESAEVSPVVAVKSPVRRSSPRRALTPVSPMSPALFEIKAPRAAKTEAVTTSPCRRGKRSPGAKSVTNAVQTPTPRKRRRSSGNATTVRVKREPALFNGARAIVNGATTEQSQVADSQTQQTQPPIEIETFMVGDLVDVVDRTWVGSNKPGGAARIVQIHDDGTYKVKFVIGPRSESHVPGYYIRRPAEELLSDTTPSRTVKKRQRRRVSDIASPPSVSDVKRGRPRASSNLSIKATVKPSTKHSGMVFLCSGFKEDRMRQIDEWADLLGADVVQCWTNRVTHLIAKCVNGDEDDDEDGYGGNTDSSSSPTGQKTGKRKLFSDPSPAKSGRWVLIRSLKYLKALVGGRWIVSDEWLQACAAHGGYVREVNYEADGHLKGKRIHDAVRRSRLAREKLLQLSPPDVDHSDVGTMLFADYFFYVIGDFLPPMPPTAELNTLICMGGGKLIAFLDNIPAEMSKHENRSRKLIIVSDKLNPRALHGQTKELRALPQLHAVPSTIIVNYLWVINSISEAKLRDLP